MVVNLKNDAGVMRKAPVGFSWTMLLFGPFLPLFRGDLKWTILHLLTLLLTVLLPHLFFRYFLHFYEVLPWYTLKSLTQLVQQLGFGIGWIVWSFIYNKRYIVNLLERGYKPADEESRIALASRWIIIDMNLKE